MGTAGGQAGGQGSKYILYRLYMTGKRIVAPWKVVAPGSSTKRPGTRRTRFADRAYVLILSRTLESRARHRRDSRPREDADALPNAFARLAARAPHPQSSRNASSRNGRSRSAVLDLVAVSFLASSSALPSLRTACPHLLARSRSTKQQSDISAARTHWSAGRRSRAARPLPARCALSQFGAALCDQ